VAGWSASWGPTEKPTDRCAECGELVIYNPTLGEGPVRLVCIDCLHLGATRG
jgi:formylmethanofuran dehydrogenase subunit E